MAAIVGTVGDDTLSGTASNDAIDGLEGTDTFVYGGAYKDVSEFASSTGFRVNATKFGEGVDTLHNVEHIEFTDGVRLTVSPGTDDQSVVVASDENGAYAWSTQRTTYDADGRILNKRTNFDDGTAIAQALTYHANGTLATSYEKDGPGTSEGNHAWDSRLSVYTDEKLLTTHIINYDNGATKTIRYGYDEGNDLARQTTFDGALDSNGDIVEGTGQTTWARRDAWFDSYGRVEKTATLFDDGTSATQGYVYSVKTGNVLERTIYDGELVGMSNGEPVVVNGRWAWEEKKITYNDAGDPQIVETTFDDGKEHTVNLLYGDEGVLWAKVEFDGGYDETTQGYENGRATWAHRVTKYDAKGETIETSFEMDNGDTFSKEFVDGVMVRRVETDVSDSQRWAERVDEWDSEGNMTRTIEWDDGTYSVV